MATIEVSLPDRIDENIDRLVEQGDFINRDQAIEELLQRGVSAYNTTSEGNELEGSFEEMFTEEQGDPAARDDPSGDDRTF